jgi:hypothetical protein
MMIEVQQFESLNIPRSSEEKLRPTQLEKSTMCGSIGEI